MAYVDLLKDPRWQRRRLEILERDGWACRSCGATDRTLHVHHRLYKGNPWDVEPEFLVTLCEPCHEQATADVAKLRELLGRISEGSIPQVIGYVEGLLTRLNGEEAELAGKGTPWIDGFANAYDLHPGEVVAESTHQLDLETFRRLGRDRLAAVMRLWRRSA
jgi:hypothetical protein